MKRSILLFIIVLFCSSTCFADPSSFPAPSTCSTQYLIKKTKALKAHLKECKDTTILLEKRIKAFEETAKSGELSPITPTAYLNMKRWLDEVRCCLVDCKKKYDEYKEELK